MRETDPTDHRAKFVRLTDSGRQLVERVLINHQRQIESVFGGLKAEEQNRFHRLLLRVGRHLEQLENSGVSAAAG
jgi:DNA-binding MarR family transcriptional regulator